MANILVPSRRVWTQQPRGPVDVDLPPNALLRFLMMGSEGARDLAGGVLSITGVPFIGHWMGHSIRFNLANRFTSSIKVKNRGKFTVLFVGSMDTPTVTGSQHLFGQWAQNTAPGDATAYDWSIYESIGADQIFLQVSNGTSGVATQPAAAPAWKATSAKGGPNAPRRIAASFNNGYPAISVDGGPAAVGSQLSGNQVAANHGISSGGYWSGQSAYDPFVRINLAVVIDGYSASPGELRSLSENPWQIFHPRRQISYFDMGAGGGISVDPLTGHLVFEGYVPSIAQSDHRNVSPSSGRVEATGHQPIVVVGANISVSPDTGHISISGYMPTVQQSAGIMVSPIKGSIRFNGNAPGVEQHINVSPGKGSIAFNGYTPGVSSSASISVTPGTAHLQLSGRSPVVFRENSQVLTPVGGHLSRNGHAPTISQNPPGASPSVEEIVAAILSNPETLTLSKFIALN